VTTLDSYWSATAANWHRLGSPLRPTPGDVALYQQALRRWRQQREEPACGILLLGVTQELRSMEWPADAELVACDRSSAMIGTLWSRAHFSGRFAAPVLADWRALPLRDRSRSIAIGDNCAMLLSNTMLRQLRDSLDRVLDEQPLLLLRVHVRPDRPEPSANIAAEAAAARIRSFHAFKWRLAMAEQGSSAAGVRLADVWDAFQSLFPDRSALSERSGWPVEAIDTIDSYRGAEVRYFYHRLDEFADAMLPAFEIESIDYPDYELGERCPVIAMRRP
jgi:hypothetical protein